ncbi:MAG: glycoside hydrolase N-terminal domain-containing protein [Armatimonadetes bacterium]|nr:glycoside hydrolase N-terminal domain-containing protein [Armatimonadota bacterium]
MKWPSLLLAILLPGSIMAFDSSTTIWATAPAAKFYDSSPLGNGRIGAMVFGGVGEDRIVLNESTVWSGGPQDADREDAYKVLPEIRNLLLHDENRKAQDLLQQNFICKGPGTSFGSAKDAPYGCYQILGNLRVRYLGEQATDYSRILDLKAATSIVSYKTGDGQIERKAFVSAPDQVFVYHVQASKGEKLNLDISMDRPENATSSVSGSHIRLAGQLKSGLPNVEGVRFLGHARVLNIGGQQHPEGAGIHVMNADEVLILVAAGTSMFDPHFEVTCLNQLERAAKRSFKDLNGRQIRDVRQFFSRVDLDLPKTESSKLPTIERLAEQAKGKPDPDLAALYFNFGRYLLFSSSRPDSPLPANLQGIWAEELQTPWNGDFHLDINLQMNYWPAEVCNLSDCTKPLLDFLPKLVPNGRKTAKAYYNARGWVAHVVTNPWCFTSPGEGAGWGSTVSGGAWLTEHQWDHYAFTGDKAYLKSAYPVMKEAALFFTDMLMAEPKHGWLVTAPSNSPENTYIHPTQGNLNTCMGPTMDQQIVHELFENTIKASEVLGVDPDFRKELQDKLAKLAPMQIAPDGRLQEWLEPYKEAEPHHRHVSHLYGLYPSNQITVDGTPALAEAAKKSLEARGDDGTGWSLAWKVNFWARLHDGNHALKILHRLLMPTGVEGYNYTNGGGTYSNLFDAHPPFQIDGNFGATAGIAEMLLQSRDGEITLLPALPDEWAAKGSVKGLRARGDLTVEINWRNGHVVEYRLTGPNAKTTKVTFGTGREPVKHKATNG